MAYYSFKRKRKNCGQLFYEWFSYYFVKTRQRSNAIGKEEELYQRRWEEEEKIIRDRRRKKREEESGQGESA